MTTISQLNMIDVSKLDPVFFCGHRASGGGMYMGVFDFHPELLVFPHECKFFQLFYPLAEIKKLKPEEKINQIINFNLKFLKSGFFDVCKADKSYFNFEKFIEKFKYEARKKDDWKNYLRAIFQAYAETTPQKLDNLKYYIERTSSTEIYASEIFKKIPNAKFIHNIRDPRDNYASMKSRWEKKLKHLSDSDSIEALKQTCIMRGRLGIDMGIVNQKIWGKDKYIFTKYDEMVSNTDKEIEKISKFLNINPKNFDKKPTFCGLDWPGNNFDNKDFKTISKSQSGSWKERITDEEAALMEFHFKDVFEFFDYNLYFSDKERADAAREHYKWLNYSSKWKADFSLSTKAKW